MKKLTAGLMAVGLLAVAAPAMAQTADPLGLIASGAVIPYVGAGGIGGVGAGSGAFLDISSPMGQNTNLHMFFFDVNCNRVGPSVAYPLTTNEGNFLNLSAIPNIPSTGLVAIGGVGNSGGADDVLQPLNNPIHARMLWLNGGGGVSRVLEPISIDNPEAIIGANWNPLRTGATFVAPLEGGTVTTALYLVCPTQAIIPGPFPTTDFLALDPVPVPAGNSTPLFARIYDNEEKFLRNVDVTCKCWNVHPVLGIDEVYGNSDPDIGAPKGTYTELEGRPACDGGDHECSFTGYRSVQWGAGVVGNDFFGRLNNANFQSLRGIGPLPIR